MEAASELKFKPLIGTDEATIDDKGRILFSKKKRERLGDNFAIALGAPGCLVAYPEHAWAKTLSEIFSYQSISQGREQYARLTLGLADDELKFDSQGRVVIPQKLRELAKLRDKVLLIGLGDRVEIWAQQEWEEFNRYPEEYGKGRREAILRAYEQMTRSPGGSSGA